LRVDSPKEHERFDLNNCKWHLGSSVVDEIDMFLKIRHAVVIQAPAVRIVCGRTPDMKRLWSAFLTLSSVHRYSPASWLRVTLLGIAGALVGGFIGALTGSAVEAWIAQTGWLVVLGVVGIIEGGLVAIILQTITVEGAVAARNRLHPAAFGIGFFIIGFKVGELGGWPGALTVGTLNGAFGVLFGYLCRSRIDAEQAEFEFSRE
jgi:hypothetical protein